MYLNGFLFFYIVQEKLRAHFITLFSKYHIYHFFLHTYSFSFYLSPPSTQNGADVYNFLKTRWENIHLFLFVFKTVHKQLSKLNQLLNRNWQLNSRKSFTGQFLGLCGKRESYDANGISLWEKRKLRCFINSDGENVRKWVLNLVPKFHDDPTVNEHEIVVLLRRVWVYAGKREGFGRGRRENKFEMKRKREDVSLV